MCRTNISIFLSKFLINQISLRFSFDFLPEEDWQNDKSNRNQQNEQGKCCFPIKTHLNQFYYGFDCDLSRFSSSDVKDDRQIILLIALRFKKEEH